MENRQKQVSHPSPIDTEALPGKQRFSWWDYILSWRSAWSHVAQTSGTTTVSSISVSPPSASLPSDPVALTEVQWNNVDQVFLDSVLMNKEGFEVVSKLKGDDAAVIINLLDKILDSKNLPDLQRRRYLAVQRKLCGNCGVLPVSCTHTDELEKVGDLPKTGGGFSEVWEGRLKGQKVAIKALRLHTLGDPSRLQKRLCKEAVVWKRLSHPNILPFIGSAHLPSFSLLSPWMDHGDINDYLKSYPQADRIALLSDIADGLSYLHSNNIVHGDLKGRNVLINENRQACLADFVLTTIVSDMIPDHSLDVFGSGTIRWTAPELFSPNEFDLEKCVPWKQSDIYAFGMVIYEIVTGTVPFAQLRQTEVVSKVIDGFRPERPTDSTIMEVVNSVWPLAEECWCQQPNERPTISQVLDRLQSSVKPDP